MSSPYRIGIRPSEATLSRVPSKRHVIEEMSFSKKFIICVCGWKGEIDQFQEHRKDYGLPVRTVF